MSLLDSPSNKNGHGRNGQFVTSAQLLAKLARSQNESISIDEINIIILINKICIHKMSIIMKA